MKFSTIDARMKFSGSAERFREDVHRVTSLEATLSDFNWSDFFRTRSIDYQGDEVKVAQYFTWGNISPALPREIGRVPLEEVCAQGAAHYVRNFGSFLKAPETWDLVQAPRVMVKDEAWGEVCDGLVSSGVCVLLKRDEIFHTAQGPLLNDETHEGVEVFRLIMNLIPLNRISEPLAGDIETLPTWAMMNPLWLQPSETLLVSSEDVRCFFYTMSVPSAWWPFLAFNKQVPRSLPPS